MPLGLQPALRLGRAAVAAVRVRGSRSAAEGLVALGRLIGLGRRCLPALPGVAGAVAVSLGVGQITGHIFGRGLGPWVTLLVAGGFALAIDRQTSIPSRGG